MTSKTESSNYFFLQVTKNTTTEKRMDGQCETKKSTS